jgi:formyl-CoA transferase
MPMPLEGIRVIDWTIWQQGPVASTMLGDLGAEVIKIESPDGGDPGRGIMAMGGASLEDRPNFYFEANNRNKRSMTLDLKQPEAKEIVQELVAVSDVFVQNFRKGVAGRLGLDYATLRSSNERLIYASATGYGPEGSESGDPSFDQLGLARSGMPPESPTCRPCPSRAASRIRWVRSCSPTVCSPRSWRASASGWVSRSTPPISAAWRSSRACRSRRVS